MQSVVIHVAFDVLAWLAAGACALWLTRSCDISFPASISEPTYLAALVFAGLIGGGGSGPLPILWLICPAISAGGIILIAKAIR